MHGKELPFNFTLWLQGQRRSEESAAATAVAAANAVTGGPPPRQMHYQRGLQMPAATPAQRPASSSLGSVDSLMSLGLDMPVNSGHRNLRPSDRAPGAGNLRLPPPLSLPLPPPAH